MVVRKDNLKMKAQTKKAPAIKLKMKLDAVETIRKYVGSWS